MLVFKQYWFLHSKERYVVDGTVVTCESYKCSFAMCIFDCKIVIEIVQFGKMLKVDC